MDARTFDHWTATIARRRHRRGALGLLAGGVLAGLHAHRGATSARARQRADRDDDGLYDDDETDVYGTNPDVYDTDGDGVGDGEEVYLGTDPLTPEGGAPPAGCGAGLTDCGGICVDTTTDRNNCGTCGMACAEFVNCWDSACGGTGAPPAEAPPAVEEPCPVNMLRCNGVCVYPYSDSSHCGACNNVCGTIFCTSQPEGICYTYCNAGTCVPYY